MIILNLCVRKITNAIPDEPHIPIFSNELLIGFKTPTKLSPGFYSFSFIQSVYSFSLFKKNWIDSVYFV